ncbi:MAG: hypothetical protein WC796_06220 [Candidatus Pacearchaeota archaeon]|jgi:hypothetical protein
MTNRKKRLEKGIQSLENQREIHEKKLEKAEEEKDEYLVRYYIKEIDILKGEEEKKKKLLDKQ